MLDLEEAAGPTALMLSSARLPTRYGTFRARAFVCPPALQEHVALVRGRVKGRRDVLVRLHSACLTGEAFGSLRCDCGDQLRGALERLVKEGAGVLVYLAQEGRGIGLVNKVAAYALQDRGADTVAANEILGFPPDMREYRAAAAVLKALGIRSVRLMTNNPGKIEALEALGIDVAERVPLEVPATRANRKYMETKRDRLHHLLRTP